MSEAYRRESFWYCFNQSIGAGLTVDVDILLKFRNIELEGWGVQQTNTNRELVTQLLIKETSGQEVIVCPTEFNDSGTASITNAAIRPPLSTVVYDPTAHREIPISPFRWCDCQYATIRTTNLNVSNSLMIYGHVRGIGYG